MARPGVLALWALLGSTVVAGAQPVEERRDQPWQVASLLDETGARRPFVFGLEFEKNGTAWLATNIGLLRYDGFDWRRFTTADGLPSDFVRSVLITRDGVLWVGTGHGAGVFDGTHFDARGSTAGLAGPSVRRMVEDPDGTIWFCSDRWPDTSIPGGLTSLKDGVWRRYGTADGLPHDHLLNYYRDSRERQFALTIHGLSQKIGDRWGPPQDPGFPADPQKTWQMVELPDRRLIVQQWDRIVVLEDGRWSARPHAYGPLLVTREGELITVRPDIFNRSVTFDRWSEPERAGGGFASGSFVPASVEFTGIRDVWPELLRQAPDGAVWCVGSGILLRWEYGDRTWRTFHGLPPPRLADPRGRTWFADDRSAWVTSGATFTRIEGAREPVTSGAGDDVWTATLDGGLARIAGDGEGNAGAIRRFSRADIGVTPDGRRVLDADGRLWVVGEIANRQPALGRFDGDRWRVISGFTGYSILSVEPDAAHGLWFTLQKVGTSAYAIARLERNDLQLVPLTHAPPMERPELSIRGRTLVLYDYLGVFETTIDHFSEWHQVKLPYDGTVWHVPAEDAVWFLFNGARQSGMGVSVIRGNVWRHFPVDWRGVAVRAHDRDTLLLPGEGGFWIIRNQDQREPDFVTVPSGEAVNQVIEDRDGTFWAATRREVFRYRPPALSPRAHVTSAVQEVRQDRDLFVTLGARLRYANADNSGRFQYSWRVDAAPWRAFSSTAQIALHGGELPRGPHRIEARARDAAGNVSPAASLAFTVLPIPLQERRWFWPVVASLGALLAYLTVVSWSAKQRLAAQAQQLEAKVRERTVALERDLATRQRIEAALRDSEQRFRGVFNSTFQLIGLLTPDGTVEEMNQTALDLIGASRDEVIGRPFWETPWWNHSPALQSQLRDAVARAAAGELMRFEAQHRTRTGAMRTVDFSLKPVLDDTGRVAWLLPEGRDITERTVAEEARARFEMQTRQGQKLEAIGTLAGGIAHDFNNILTAIIGNAEMAALDSSASRHMHERIAEVLRAALRARDLVNQILVFSRRQEQERKSIQLRDVLLETLRLMRASLPSTIEIQTDLAGSFPPVLADSTQIHQVMMNLCTNAAHAMRNMRGTLTIQQKVVDVHADMARLNPRLRVGRYVRVSVSDTGHGMDARTQDRIFEPFFTTKRSGEGTGLGLAVVHGIMEAHDGAITVESQPGLGTTFHLYFPAVEAVAEEQAPEAPAMPKGAGQRVLVVDDEAAVAQTTVHLLEQAGYRAEACTDPQAALARFRADPDGFALVLTDLTMPRLTGLELAAEIRRVRPDVRLLLGTGFSADLDDQRLTELGFSGLVLKPYTLRTLADAAARALQRWMRA
jgi:PAS domain S-box-containing protein